MLKTVFSSRLRRRQHWREARLPEVRLALRNSQWPQSCQVEVQWNCTVALALESVARRSQQQRVGFHSRRPPGQGSSGLFFSWRSDSTSWSRKSAVSRAPQIGGQAETDRSRALASFQRFSRPEHWAPPQKQRGDDVVRKVRTLGHTEVGSNRIRVTRLRHAIHPITGVPLT